MGCSYSKQQIIQPTPIFDKIFSEKEYLDHMIKYIIESNQFCYVLDRVLFEDIKNQLTELCWPYQDKASLARLIQDYIRFSIQETHAVVKNGKSSVQKKTKYQIQKFGLDFGEEVDAILKSVINKNRDIIGTLQFYNNFAKWQFPLGIETEKKKQDIRQTIKQINKIAQHCEECFFYLSLILVKGCKKLQKQKVSLFQINRLLQQTIQFINVETIDTPQTNIVSQTMFVYHELRSKQYQLYPTKLYTQKFPYTQIHLQGNGEQREHQYQQQIIKIVQNAKLEFQFFDGFMYSVCKLFKCKKFKINFKLKYREDIQAMERIKQKILFKQKNSYQKDGNLRYSSIEELREMEKANRVQEMRKILDGNQKIVLDISDLLRGRCLFPTIQDLIEATTQIIKKIHKKKERGVDIELLAIQNRLKDRTSDLVLKIKIRTTVAEFQMALAPIKQPQSFKNAIYHKVYEMKRSKMLSSISMLFNWHEKMTVSYIKFLQKVFKHANTQKKAEDTEIFQRIINDQQIKIIMQRDEKVPGGSEKIAVKNDIVAILLANKILDDTKVQKIKETTMERTADFYQKIGNKKRQTQILKRGINDQKISELQIQRYKRRLSILEGERKHLVQKKTTL